MDPKQIKKDFPLLATKIDNHDLVYLDSAATTQKPQCVIDALTRYYTETNANIHRGVYRLSEIATNAFEEARETVRRFIHAKHTKECIFVKSTTEAINCVATSFGEVFVHEGDQILISAMGHHSNIVPWQMLCQRKGATLKVVPMNNHGDLNLDELDHYLNPTVKMLAITQVSNAIGTINPLDSIIQKAHAKHIPVLIDGAQSAPHMPIDVQQLDCDFFTFSGHKTYGPTGIGILYGKTHWLEKIPPYQGGGDMILQVSFERTTYNHIPYKFEAGTPPIAEAIALAHALEYLEDLGYDRILSHEATLLNYLTQRLSEIPSIKIIGTSKNKIGLVSFTMEGIHPHDIGSIIDQYGVAIRTGHHCAMPLMDFFKVPATARVSFGVYNTTDDVDRLMDALREVQRLFKHSFN